METSNLSIGYCTNVHAGITLEAALANLRTYACAVRQEVTPNGRLPVGLWLAEPVAQKLVEENRVLELRDWLAEHHLLAYTFNGFPQGDFHQSVVKHAVYEPTWVCESRARYTKELAEILEALLPPGGQGSISTLPLGWPHAPWHAENLKAAADNLLDVARYLDRLNQQRGCEIVLAIEPEPGCVLNTASEVIEFFEHYLFSGPDAETARRYLSVCHDVCHSGVMFEPQKEALQAYLKAGIRIGKVQVSSAVHVPWDGVVDQPEQQQAMLQQVRGFSEPKYLHQTTRCNADGRLDVQCEDLSQALTKWIPNQSFPTNAWRIHFHVPIFVESFGSLSTTQKDIGLALEFLQAHRETKVADQRWFTGHYEVETYAWPVLPPELAIENLATGIAKELQYVEGLNSQVHPIP